MLLFAKNAEFLHIPSYHFNCLLTWTSTNCRKEWWTLNPPGMQGLTHIAVYLTYMWIRIFFQDIFFKEYVVQPHVKLNLPLYLTLLLFLLFLNSTLDAIVHNFLKTPPFFSTISTSSSHRTLKEKLGNGGIQPQF